MCVSLIFCHIVNNSYRQLARKIHPDKVHVESEKQRAKEKFTVLVKIKDALLDPNKRSTYDREGIVDDKPQLTDRPQLSTNIATFRQCYRGM